jgi:hypothetical protein
LMCSPSFISACLPAVPSEMFPICFFSETKLFVTIVQDESWHSGSSITQVLQVAVLLATNYWCLKALWFFDTSVNVTSRHVVTTHKPWIFRNTVPLPLYLMRLVAVFHVGVQFQLPGRVCGICGGDTKGQSSPAPR